MYFSYLLLAHIIGDFTLQPYKLVKWKTKSLYGILAHATIHVFVLFFVLLPFLYEDLLFLLGVCLGLGILHFIIDYTKISIDLVYDKKMRLFVFDQILHFITLLGAAYIISKRGVMVASENFIFKLYTDWKILTFIMLALFAGYVIEIVKIIRLKQTTHKVHKKSTKDMIRRVFVFAVIYLIILILVWAESRF